MPHKNGFGKIIALNALLFLSTFCWLLTSCNPTKYVKDGELFLKKHSVKISGEKLDKEEVERIIKQKPNRKILGAFRFHLWVYNRFKENSESKIKQNIGEAPVVYDSLMANRSAKQLKLYADKKGYFDSKVEYSTKINGKKVKVNYEIITGEPYTINDIKYEIADEGIKELMIGILIRSKLRTGKNLDIDLLNEERERIKTQMRNEGYYYFSKDYVKFKADTTIGDKKVNLELHISKQKVKNEEQDTTFEVNHKKYRIKDINIYLSKDYKGKNLYEFDTISFKKVDIHHDGELIYRPRMLNHAIGLNKGGLFILDDQRSTYKHLTELNIFKNVNISYEDIGDQQLTTNIFLTPAYTKSFSIEGVGTNSGGNLGVEGNLIYRNRNLFRGGEQFMIKLNGGLEAQQLINEEQSDFRFLGLPFNTFEFGPEVNLEFPRFLLPVSLEKFSRRANPKTNLNVQLNYQKRPEFERNLFQTTFGYFWNESKRKKHFINPINFSVIQLNPTDAFEEAIAKENNPFILNSYQDHFINSTSYSFLYNDQVVNKRVDFMFFRITTEFAGNIQSAFNKLTNKPYDNPESESYNVFNIRYAQFAKADFDIRFYEQSPLTTFVSRFNIGVGVPYGNLNVLPFEKGYFGGGANDIRAWQARSLGPGSLPDSLTQNSLNQIGELKIEGNLEYRFDITKIIEGATFIDAGNIWLLNEDPERPNAEFRLDKLWRDVAIGVGIGLRLDFNFFLIRFDLASKLKDPAAANPEKFDLIWDKPTLNLGIGYPF